MVITLVIPSSPAGCRRPAARVMRSAPASWLHRNVGPWVPPPYQERGRLSSLLQRTLTASGAHITKHGRRHGARRKHTPDEPVVRHARERQPRYLRARLDHAVERHPPTQRRQVRLIEAHAVVGEPARPEP